MKKPQFVLSRMNQKGQVAIFVALIFQVIFVFFALLINVGLIVHHKINLQQSTDLAAYYGAMKQAEGLNAIAHINYQLRQNWKLLAWRYRVLGTFGMQKSNASDPIRFPVNLPNTNPLQAGTVTANEVANSCPGQDNVSTVTHPFFCIGHGGMNGWYNPLENNCKVDCGIVANTAAFPVNGIPTMQIYQGNGISDTVNTTFMSVNAGLNEYCSALGKTNIGVLVKMLLSYKRESQMRSQTLLMLASNLSKEKFVDLDGGDVEVGVRTTLLNNLTEANRTSLVGSPNRIQMFNSLSGGECAMAPDKESIGNKQISRKEFLKRIEFNLVQFFIHDCKWDAAGAGSQNFRSGTIFNKDRTGFADGQLDPFGKPTPDLSMVPSAIVNDIMEMVSSDNRRFTIGYEKNPWCPAYYFVSASADPMIPFLPLVKIKLSAHAAAKPFGGSVGPWYSNKWEQGNPTTQEAVAGFSSSGQVDEALPIARNVNGTVPTRNDTKRFLPNYGFFVGDKDGLMDPYIVAEYHAALVNRTATADVLTVKAQDNALRTGSLSKPDVWPALNSWDNAYSPEQNGYDPLSMYNGSKSTGLRDLEISAIAPNQFDVTYYSIDPDFYNNYYLKIFNNYDKIRANASFSVEKKEYIRPDFGNNRNIYTSNPDFSVRNQIEIVKKVFAGNFRNTMAQAKSRFIEAFPFLVTKQSSLLTGWTFKLFTNFAEFPGDEVSSAQGTMSFGRCRDEWAKSDSEDAYLSASSTGNPPTPGNCITGGRTGYSVKLVSPNMLRDSAPPQQLGGLNAGAGPIHNPIPAAKFSY